MYVIQITHYRVRENISMKENWGKTNFSIMTTKTWFPFGILLTSSINLFEHKKIFDFMTMLELENSRIFIFFSLLQLIPLMVTLELRIRKKRNLKSFSHCCFLGNKTVRARQQMPIFPSHSNIKENLLCIMRTVNCSFHTNDWEQFCKNMDYMEIMKIQRKTLINL